MRCPVCKAENNQGPHCRRCRADLSLLWMVEEQRSILLAAARRRARNQQGSQLVHLVDQIENLRRDQQSQSWRALGYLLQGDYARAWQAYLQVKEAGRK